MNYLTQDEKCPHSLPGDDGTALCCIRNDNCGCDNADKPRRIQLSRKRGWRMPPNTMKVSRPGPWGNPYRTGDHLVKGPYAGIAVRDAKHAVVLFREWALAAIRGAAYPQENGNPAPTKDEVAAALGKLCAKNLACWCKPNEPCHADVLLELANGPVCEEVNAT